MTEPRWLTEARKHLGQKEVPGAASNPWIKAMWLKLKGGLWFWNAYGTDDSKLPWCGGFMAFCFDAVGIAYPAKYASAKEWLAWGTPLPQPIVGCVVIFDRAGGGHVGLVTGKTQDGRLMVLGGNQKDGVCELPFDRARAIGYRWPLPGPAVLEPLPLVASAAASSSNEA